MFEGCGSVESVAECGTLRHYFNGDRELARIVSDANADFIASSRASVPALCGALRDLAAALEKSRARWEDAGEAFEAFAGLEARKECDEEIAKIDAALADAAARLGQTKTGA
jgi:hypothetical protein